MSGKFLRCSTLISFFLPALLWAQSAVVPDTRNQYFLERSGTSQQDQDTAGIHKTNLTINGFTLYSPDTRDMSGLRAKAMADLLQRRGSQSLAIKYYETALKTIPEEADIYFNLGNIYLEKRVWQLASRYYALAVAKYTMPENFAKTQKYRYLSLIRQGIALEKMRDDSDNHRKAEKIVLELMDYEKEIRKNYPEIIKEMDTFIRLVYGDMPVNR